MISKALMELIFSAASIERWNDHPRTPQFTELDKQSHKAMIAWFIARAEEDRGRTVNWDRLIRNGAFSFLHRVLVTDIKPLQPWKVPPPIDVTLSGMVTDVKPLQS